MKKIILFLLLFITIKLSSQVSDNRVDTYWAARVVPVKQFRDSTWISFWNKVTDGIPWTTFGNAISTNTNFIGTTTARSLVMKTNNNTWLKIDSIGVLRMFNTSGTSTISGTIWYDQPLGGLTIRTNSTDLNWSMSFTDGTVVTAIANNHLAGSPAYDGAWFASRSRHPVHLVAYGDGGGIPALTVGSSTIGANNPVIINGNVGSGTVIANIAYTSTAQFEVNQGGGIYVMRMNRTIPSTSINTQFWSVSATGLTAMGFSTTATAILHLGPGSTSLQPMRYTSGALATGTAIIIGGVEFDTDKWYGTISTGTLQKEFTMNDIALTSGRVPITTTNGRLTDDANFTYTNSILTVPNMLATSNVTVSGNLTISGSIIVTNSLSVASLSVTDLTATRVVFVGTGSKLVDNSSFTYGDITGILNIPILNTSSTATIGGDFLASANATIIGSTNITGSLNVVGTLTVASLTSGRVPFMGAGGKFLDNANFTYGAISGILSTPILNTSATATVGTDLTVGNNAQITGSVNVTTTLTAASVIASNLGTNRVVFASAGGRLNDNSGLTFTSGAGLVTTSLSVTGTATFTGIFKTLNNSFFGGTTTPSARIHIAAGTTVASTAPQKFTTGPLNTTAEAGAKEYNNSFYSTKNSGLRYGEGGVIADFYTDANNSGTGETDLYSYTTPANTLEMDGGKITAQYGGTFNDVTATAQLKIYYAGTVIGNTGALTISATGGWNVNVLLIRTSSTTVRAITNVSTPGASTAVYTAQTDITGLTLSTTNIIKITGTSGGAGGGSSDITAKLGTVNWMGPANN